MKLAPHQLVENGFVLIDELDHQDLMPFIQRYLKHRTFTTILYYVVNTMMLIPVIILMIQHGQSNFSNAFAHLGYGILASFALIPLHEYIHALAYKTVGAIHTSYDANWKKFYFMAIADQFVANRKEFRIVALAPFLTITAILFALLFFVLGVWMLTIAGTMLMHTAMCSGDFGLLSYFDVHKDKELLTYDDKALGRSYFYAK